MTSGPVFQPQNTPRLPTWVLSLSFFGVLAMCGRLGPMSSVLARALAVVLIGTPFLLRLLLSAAPARLGTLVWSAVGCACLLLGGLLPEWWRAGALAAAFGCWSAALSRPEDRAALRHLAAGSALFAIVLPWFDAFPPLLEAQEGWSTFISSLARAATGRPVSAGPSALGFDPILLLACLALGAQLCRPASTAVRWRVIGWAVVLGQAVALAWAVALAFLPGFDAPLQFEPEAAREPLGLLWSAVLPRLSMWGPWLVSIPLAAVLPRLLSAPHEARRAGELPEPAPGSPLAPVAWSRRLAAVGAIVLLAFAGGSGAWLEQPRVARGKTVVLYEKGFLNWLQPGFGFFGRESGGMFGMLPAFLESLGLRTRKTAVLDSSVLRGASVLFLANPETPLTPSEREALWTFVRAGGHLLLLGDHTWLRGRAGNPMNVILEPTEIRYRIDSANFFTGGWEGGYRFPVSPLTAGMAPDDNSPCMVVGASLEIGPGARPLLVGRWGYSDAPALADTSGGNLGDLAYGRGERVGDLVLIATQQMGKGRVTVLGDTSPFFNGIMCSSYPFVSRLFLWAASRPPDPPFRLFLLDALLALVAGLALAYSSRRTFAALIAGAVLATTLGSLGLERQKRWPEPFVRGNLAFVDISHLPLVHVGDWDVQAIMGLPIGLMRCGYQTHFLDRLDDPALDRARLLVMVAPRRKVGAREAARLLDWVARGGTLILSVGAEEESQAHSLLQRLGLVIRPVPLGNILVDGPRGPVHTAEAWAIEKARAGDRDPEVLLRSGQYWIAVGLRWGEGRVAVIGDSQFFANFNLEHGEHAHVGNVVFLADLVGGNAPPALVKQVTRATP